MTKTAKQLAWEEVEALQESMLKTQMDLDFAWEKYHKISKEEDVFRKLKEHSESVGLNLPDKAIKEIAEKVSRDSEEGRCQS